ncbi:Methylmalonyl-CoA mutase [[Actinomadura] parvosata subsp. kistnae]|uniref:methylmalonyl-CoA mutase n=1 Tax=[Actinomadura] parvosata subsp. kistnae TaxID=1909395 RepID=A0A1V0A314_9ACTN|nr:methylmalonyl-CoA mutase subunit beta [Nonomuraea sp. ATCC 55076]AQZ64601.1 methylmalonyl-CoA mutase [Nonomuraea sp. ATCC 55076]SPL99570.1 Methylmalonyl-CoA mutase [Actinomadura parvosata subsp. kistnae]
MELAAGFASISRDDWRALAAEVLRKSGIEAGSPEEVLSRATYDGVTVAPLYDAGDLPGDPGLPGAAPYVRGARAAGGWDVRQRHAVADPEAVLADLENGVTSLWLVVGDGAIPVGELGAVLKDVYLDLAPVVLEAGERTPEAADALFALAAARRPEPGAPAGPGAGEGALRGNLGASAVLGTGGTELALRCAAEYPGLRAVTVDATPYHDAGGSDAEELACSIAQGVAELRALTGGGLSVEQALGQIEFRYAATADQFATIAKLRAARRLWARVAEVCGAPGAGGQRQHAVTSSAMMTARDPWVNMLRTTIACFAAGVGGAQAVTVQPFDACLGLPDAFSRRIARNTQSLLLEESGLGRVIDPAGGSWYVERRTADLAAAAWAFFQEIEAGGGIVAAAELVSGRIAATRERRDDDIAHRRFPITGVSEFPDLGEKPVRRRPAQAPRDSGGLPRVRYAEPFERLRDLADARPERPKVFLATIGPLAAHTARAAFAANLFHAGGLATETAGPGTDPEQIATAFAVSGATVACLCSSDKLYAQHATAVAKALRRAGARKVWLAGKGHYEGVDALLHAGCDALAVLRETFDDLEVTR